MSASGSTRERAGKPERRYRVFECVVCGLCTEDALVYSLADARNVVAFCGPHCRRTFRRERWKFLSKQNPANWTDRLF
jgi:hypothetical protein